MSISFACSKCGYNLKAPDSCTGRQSKCPKCGTAVVVPGPTADVSGLTSPQLPQEGSMIRFFCPTCCGPLSAPPEKIGAKASCPKCGQRVQVPNPGQNKTVLGRLVPAGGEVVNPPIAQVNAGPILASETMPLVSTRAELLQPDVQPKSPPGPEPAALDVLPTSPAPSHPRDRRLGTEYDKQPSRKSKKGIPTVLWVIGIPALLILVCCGGCLGLGSYFSWSESKEIAKADSLWSQGKHAEAVAIYKEHPNSTHNRSPDIFGRIIQHEAEQGNTTEARRWIDKALDNHIEVVCANQAAKDMIQTAKQERREREAKEQAQREAEREERKKQAAAAQKERDEARTGRRNKSERGRVRANRCGSLGRTRNSSHTKS